MIKLGQTTTGTNKGVKYLWLVKSLGLYRHPEFRKECYVVMAFNGNGWWTMFNGTLKACREFIGDEEVVDI